jgi:hypothetical protein
MAVTEDFEKKIDRAYRRFAPLAQRDYFTFTRPSVTVGGKPSVLFLGNHSSGKSSLVNWLLGEPAVQDTGVAPTDDGFTVVVYGDRDEDVFGPAAIARLPEEFRALESFGPTFLQHLKVKIRNRDILRRVSLVDSPGMIDSAEGAATRDYDFAGVVKRFADLCDIVFFLFDPDKPGTTGETVNVFAKCLRGIEFKLRVLLNKCDAFTGMSDFARAYGTLCWNLSRVLRTKDMPKIFTMYSGAERTPQDGGLDFSDFNRHRAEFLSIFDDPSARRTDSVFAAAYADFAGLSIRMRIIGNAMRKIRKLSSRIVWIGAGVAAFTGIVALVCVARALSADVFRFSAAAVVSWGSALAVSALTALAVAAWNRRSVRVQREALAEQVDDLFAEEFRNQTAVGTFDDLRQRWNGIRAETMDIIAHAPLSLPFFSTRKRMRLDAVAADLLDELVRSGRKRA